ncbi:MAG TPA: sialidase family protein, partial [Kofleriaceae bacterium]|nr:sialidase family protein [Kofleriaceae bacterium]
LPYFFATPVLAVDTQRKWLYVAYARGSRDAAWDLVIAASKDSGATWKRSTLAGDGCALHMVPTLALDAATGTLHIAYYDSEGAPGRFAHATCGPGVTKCKLLGAISSVTAPVLSLARSTTKSVGDYESLLVDNKRKILHAVWAQSVDEAGKPVTRIFHAAAKLKK